MRPVAARVSFMHTLPEDPLTLMSLIAALCSDLNVHDHALTIFQHVALLRDNDPNALVSLAVAQSRSGDESSALSTLRQALHADPDHDMARVTLAIHLHAAGDTEAQRLLRSVLLEAQDPDAWALAKSVEEEILNVARGPAPVKRHRYTRVCVD